MSGIKVEVKDLGYGAEHLRLMVKVIGKDGQTATVPIGRLGHLTFDVKEGQGVVLECVDMSDPGPDYILLEDKIAVRDGGV